MSVSDSTVHSRPLPVAILGMHRSGTSMVAKLLRDAGLYLGAETDLMPPAAENPEGFFEHLAFVRLNDEVLSAAGAGWDCPPPPDVDWGSDRFAPFRERARLLAGTLAGHSPWGWKDPRTTLTLSFWRSALGPLKAVAVIRNPLEVVASLHRRNGFSVALSLTLWHAYAERLIQDISPDDRLITHYDTYFLEPARETARVLAFIGLDAGPVGAAAEAAAAPGLRHHRRTARNLVEHGFPAHVIELYRQLCQEAQWWEGNGELTSYEPELVFKGMHVADTISRGMGGVDLIRVENEALRRNNADFSVAIAAREARITELELALQNHEVTRAELEGRISEREGRVQERNNLIMRRDNAVAALQQEVAHHVVEREQRQGQISNLLRQLEESQQALALSEVRERELRSSLTRLHDAQLQRDAEIMGTLGAALSRHAPGAPAAIYHRRLVEHVRQVVEEQLPADATVLVATYGDPALLRLGERKSEPFPRSAPGIAADYTDVSDDEAVAQLDAMRTAGADYLVIPGPAQPWLINHPGLERHLDQRYPAIVRERGVVTIYALGQRQDQIPA